MTDPDAYEHGYGLDADCLCGRNFDTVRGLREHLTKWRLRTLPDGGILQRRAETRHD